MEITTDRYRLMHGDCLERMRGLAENSVDAIVTDPPYGLSFMAKKWDYDVPRVEVWRESLRVLKPGGHLLTFAGTRTQHRMCCNIEDGGYEIRDMIAWIYGTGFPKSLNISKAIDKAAGAEKVIGTIPDRWTGKEGTLNFSTDRPQAEAKVTAPATPEAKRWDGWGTALKPALEPITVARKPFPGTVAANVLEYGTGGINIDACRVPNADGKPIFINGVDRDRNRSSYDTGGSNRTGETSHEGRFPANLIHDGSDEVLSIFPHTKSGAVKERHTRSTDGGNGNPHGRMKGITSPLQESSEGSAARFFYCAKATKTERDLYLTGSETSAAELTNRKPGSAGMNSPRAGSGRTNGRINKHPTVKPLALMQYLVRLVTPPGGTVLDPFMGSGSTGIACAREGFRFIGMELDPTYYGIACQRIVSAYTTEEVEHDQN